MKPVLILQARPETEAADAEFAAILRAGGLSGSDVQRIRLESEAAPTSDQLDSVSAIILGGGPGCVSDPPEKKTSEEAKIENAVMTLMPKILTEDLPFLGCCLGIGMLGHALGDYVSKDNFSEAVGVAHCEITENGVSDPILQGIASNFDAFVGHKEAMQSLPEGCVHLVQSQTCPIQMLRYKRNVYATQFHPEADGAEFELRIRLYRDRGYFPPEDADRLIALCQAASVTEPEKVLRNFVRTYAG